MGEITTEQEALAAVKRNGMALAYVPENLKTAEICLVAVKQDGDAFEFVPEPLRDEARAMLKNGDRS